SRLKDKPVQVVLSQLHSVGNQSHFECAFFDTGSVQSSPIVFDSNDNFARAMVCAQHYLAAGIFTSGDSRGWFFYPVVERVSNHMGYRICYMLDPGRVDLDIRAF